MKVAIIADVERWAFDALAHGIKKYNPDPAVEIDILYEVDLRSKGHSAILSDLSSYDVLYPFSEYQANFLLSHGVPDYITTVHMGPLGAKSPFGVVPDVHSYDPRIYASTVAAQRLSAVSPLLKSIWASVRPDVVRLSVGVDPALFSPIKAKRDGWGPLRVGWVGNPEKPMKRYDLVEAATQLPGIELRTVVWRRSQGGVPRPHADMPAFYQSLDVYLCTSDHEGLPTPALEAAACGIPLVSVPVGVASELIVEGRTGFIVSQSVEEIRRRLIYLRDQRERCHEMGDNILALIRRWYWPNIVEEWIAFMRGGG